MEQRGVEPLTLCLMRTALTILSKAYALPTELLPRKQKREQKDSNQQPVAGGLLTAFKQPLYQLSYIPKPHYPKPFPVADFDVLPSGSVRTLNLSTGH